MKVEYYADKRGKYRWRLRAGNNLIVAESGQGYSRERDARRAFAVVVDGVGGCDFAG